MAGQAPCLRRRLGAEHKARDIPRIPAARRAASRFLDCGLLEHGFARVRCEACRAEFLVTFRCKGRQFCPSCHARRLAEWSLWLGERLLLDVPRLETACRVAVARVLVLR